MTQNTGLQEAIEKARHLLKKVEPNKYVIEFAIEGFYIEARPTRVDNKIVWVFTEI